MSVTYTVMAAQDDCTANTHEITRALPRYALPAKTSLVSNSLAALIRGPAADSYTQHDLRTTQQVMPTHTGHNQRE
jgi:hypothetical protein